MTGLVDEKIAVDIVSLDFCKVFDTVFHEVLIKKMTKYELDGQIMRWTEKLAEGLSPESGDQ